MFGGGNPTANGRLSSESLTTPSFSEHIHDESRQGASRVPQLHVLQAEPDQDRLPLGLHQEPLAPVPGLSPSDGRHDHS